MFPFPAVTSAANRDLAKSLDPLNLYVPCRLRARKNNGTQSARSGENPDGCTPRCRVHGFSWSYSLADSLEGDCE